MEKEKLEEIKSYIENYEVIKRFSSEVHSLQKCTIKRSKTPKFTLGMITVDDARKELIKKKKTFADVLGETITKKGMTDPECYKKARIAKGAFNKIINGTTAKPKEKNVALLALALELDSKEYDAFLKAAGYARSNDIKDSLNIVGYFIDHNEHDIHYVDDAVKAFMDKNLANYE